MSIRYGMCAVLLSILAAGVSAAEKNRAYFSSVSDVEVEVEVKGRTYDNGPVNSLADLKKVIDGSGGGGCKSTCNVCPTACEAPKPACAPCAEGSKGDTGEPGKPCTTCGGKAVVAPVTTEVEPVTTTTVMATPAVETPVAVPVSGDQISTSIVQLGNSSWRDAQAVLISAGKDAIPSLIENLNNSNVAYNLGGHTKADSGRAPRQLTVGEVCSALLQDIVTNHSTYSGDLPGLDKNAWSDWWAKNSGSVTFAK